MDGCKEIWKAAGRLSLARVRDQELQAAQDLGRQQRAEAAERKRKTQAAKDAAFTSSAFLRSGVMRAEKELRRLRAALKLKHTRYLGKEERFIMGWDGRPKSEVYAWWVRRQGRRGTKRQCRRTTGIQADGGGMKRAGEAHSERVSSRPPATGKRAAAKGQNRPTKRKRAEQEEERERAEESRKRARDKMWKSWSSSGKVGEDEAREHKGTGSGAKDGAEPPD